MAVLIQMISTVRKTQECIGSFVLVFLIHQGFFKILYRQRAWVSLEDDRLYSTSATLLLFPTETTLEERATDARLWEECFPNKDMRTSHCSQRWHVEQRGVFHKGLVGRKYPGSNRDCECIALGLERKCECQIPGMEMQFPVECGILSWAHTHVEKPSFGELARFWHDHKDLY